MLRVFCWFVFCLALLVIAGCGSFKLGSVLYCAHSHACALETKTPAVAGAASAASAAR